MPPTVSNCCSLFRHHSSTRALRSSAFSTEAVTESRLTTGIMSGTPSGNPPPASQNAFKFLEPYHLVICAVLALSSPVGWGWPASLLSSLSEFWLHGLFLIGIALIGFITPAGSLRFGYLEYNTLVFTFFQYLPSLSPYAVLVFVFLPSYRYWMVCALPVFWQFVLQNYRKNIQDIKNKVDIARSLAMVAANSAREYAKEAVEYEKQAMEVVVVRRRDAVLAESVKVTDFFDRAAVSWAALGRTTAAAKATTIAVERARDHANAVPESRTSGTSAYYSLQKAEDALESAKIAEKEAESAQATVSQSETAQKQAATARKLASDNAENAAEAAKSLKDRMAESSAMLFKAVDGAENVTRLADQAVAAAIEGDKTTASSLAADVGRAAEEVVKAMEELKSVKEGVHEFLFELVLYKPDEEPESAEEID